MTAADRRFAFGRNWQRYVTRVDESRISIAVETLQDWFGCDSFDGRSFLDVGCGSGLFSLAAARLNAKRVQSFDYDMDSVAATERLRTTFLPNHPAWSIEQGSAVDRAYLTKLGGFDLVYAWGVLHHTGDLWAALKNLSIVVKPHGLAFVSLYNDAGRSSRIWSRVKASYARHPWLRPFVLVPAVARCWGPIVARDLISGRPLKTWRQYGRDSAGRGMSPWIDMIDWVGGYPFEASRPGDVFNCLHDEGFDLLRMSTVVGPQGCNEYLFRRRHDK